MMKIYGIVFALLVVFTQQHLKTREEYEKLTENAKFETMTYEKYVEVFKNKEHLFDDSNRSYDEHINVIKSYLEENPHRKVVNAMPHAQKERFLQSLPETFDSRTHWTPCFDLKKVAIKDQAYCGSCWAFSASYALAKRFCIANINNLGEGWDYLDLSPQDMVDCSYQNNGCHGGTVPATWEFLEKKGVVEESCQPYWSGEVNRTGPCQLYCKNWTQSYNKFHAKTHSSVYGESPEEIKYMIMTHGPVQTIMEAYDDLQTFQGCGVYEANGEGKPGGHGIAIVGWGQNNGREYWIVANSWGLHFGCNGFFNIYFDDVSKLGQFAMAGLPQ